MSFMSLSDAKKIASVWSAERFKSESESVSYQ